MRLSQAKLSGILLLPVAAALLLVIVSPARAITWGELDSAHTNVGAIVVEWPSGALMQMCSGTLIHPQIYLTAGHCTAFLESSGLKAYVNFDQDALNRSTLRPVLGVKTHPDYGGGRSNPCDVGVLIFEDPITDVTPAMLPVEGLLDELNKAGELREGCDGADFVVVGYGGTLHWPPSPPDPKVTYEHQRQFTTSEFQAQLKSWLLMSQNHATDNGGTCFGDSGGPAFWTDPATGLEVLVGVTSWGDAQCVATGFSYRTDIPDTIDFLADVETNLTDLINKWLAPEDPAGP